MELKGSRTEKDLWEAFAGECQAYRKYLVFAEQAEEEGYSQAARLFRAAAAAEVVHAKAHLKTLGAVGTTEDNLRQALNGETQEFTEMYPSMIRNAAEESQQEALKSFSWANAAEKVHAQLYKEALDNLGQQQEVALYVCKICGMIHPGEPQGPCEICNAAPGAFFAVD